MPFKKFRPQRQYGRFNTRLFREVLRARNNRKMLPTPNDFWLRRLGHNVWDPLHPNFLKQFEGQRRIKPTESVDLTMSHPLYKERKTFLFDGTRSLTDGVAQACALIQAVEAQPLPAAVRAALPGDFLPIDFEQHMVDCIMAGERFDPSLEALTKKFDPILFWTFQRRHYGTPMLMRNNIILQNLCRKVALYSMRTEAQHFEDLRYDYDEPISSYLADTNSGIGAPLVFRHQPHLILQSEKSVSPLANAESVEETKYEDVPDIYPITPLIDLETSKIYNDTALLPRLANPRLNIHTVLWAREQDQKYPWTMEENAANTICHCFGTALAQALRHFSTMEFENSNTQDKILKRPVLTKAVQLVGGRFDFVIVQLNTLNLANSKGIKNLVWLEKGCQLYKPKRTMFENMDTVEQLNLETARKFVSFLLYR